MKTERGASATALSANRLSLLEIFREIATTQPEAFGYYGVILANALALEGEAESMMAGFMLAQSDSDSAERRKQFSAGAAGTQPR